MNYFLAYQRLIAKAQLRVLLNGYVERHHILPRALGGSDDSSNLVVLTAREHFVAHILLAKIHGGLMWQAVMIMKGGKNRYFNSRLFEMARRVAANERENAIKKKRISDPAFDAYMHKVKSEATANRVEGYQVDAGQKFKHKFASDSKFAAMISKNRAKAQQASVEVIRSKSAIKAQKVLELRMQGKTYAEIMKIVDCSIGFVSKVVNYA
jgi:hypothetical protein